MPNSTSVPVDLSDPEALRTYLIRLTQLIVSGPAGGSGQSDQTTLLAQLQEQLNSFVLQANQKFSEIQQNAPLPPLNQAPLDYEDWSIDLFGAVTDVEEDPTLQDLANQAQDIASKLDALIQILEATKVLNNGP